MSYLCERCANTNCRHEIEPGEVVVQCGAFKKPMANADCIRAISDEELAEFLGGERKGRRTDYELHELMGN